jgi:holo-[acyl-carrier protein] synthase
MHGVGIDLVEIDEVRDSIQSFGERYLGRVFTPAELNECGASPARLAERFAAKEAILKALLVDGAVPMATIDTRAQGPRGLTVALAAEAAELARRRGVGHIAVSVSRRGGHAAAVAVTEAL